MKALAAALLLLAAASSEPPRNEDVVRRFVKAPSATALVAWLDEQALCEFDLSPPMRQELEEAGLPDSVLEAMQRCQRRNLPEAPASVALPMPPATGRLILEFADAVLSEEDEAWRDRATLVVDGKGRGSADSGTAATDMAFTAKDGGPAGDSVRPDSLALFVACIIPEHVPDHWRDRSPLHDNTARRHHLLLFHEQTVRTEWKKQSLLSLTHPATLTVHVPLEAHHLELGIAARRQGTWSVLVRQDVKSVTITEETPYKLRLQLQTSAKARTLRPTLNILP